MAPVERPARRDPGGERRQRAEPPHVDHPVDPSDRLEPERRHRVQERQGEAGGVVDPERRGQGKRERLTAREQGHAEAEQVSRDGRRGDEIADVAFVPVEHAVDRERAAVQEHHPDEKGPERLRQGRPPRDSSQSHGEHVSEPRVRGHDRPLGGTHVQDVGKEVTRKRPVAPATPRIDGPGVGYHVSPSAVAANRSPARVRSG